MKRVVLPLLAAIVAMLVIAAVAGGHSSKGHHRSLELMGTEASFNFVDANPTQANPDTDPPTPGDGFVISETITKHGEDFGSLYIQCTFVVADVTQCIATFDLPNGQITVQGVLRDVPDFTVAVTGGTGDYSGVGGSLAVHDPSEDGVPSTYDFQFR